MSDEPPETLRSSVITTFKSQYAYFRDRNLGFFFTLFLITIKSELTEHLFQNTETWVCVWGLYFYKSIIKESDIDELNNTILHWIDFHWSLDTKIQGKEKFAAQFAPLQAHRQIYSYYLLVTNYGVRLKFIIKYICIAKNAFFSPGWIKTIKLLSFLKISTYPSRSVCTAYFCCRQEGKWSIITAPAAITTARRSSLNYDTGLMFRRKSYQAPAEIYIFSSKAHFYSN